MGALAEAGKEAVPGLTKALEHQDAAYWACLVLAEIGPDAKDAVPALVKLLQTDNRPEVRREAMIALAGIGADAAVPALVQALEDDQEGINAGPAVYALGSIGVKAKAAEGKIKEIADSPDTPPLLQTVSLWALARMNPEDEALVREVVPKLAEALKSPKPEARAAAAQALLDLDPDPEIARPVLKKVMEDAEPEVLNDILDALAGLGEKAVPRLIAALDVEEMRAKAATIIARIGPPAKEAVPALIAALEDQSPETCCEVLFALAAIGPDAAEGVPALVKALGNPEANVCYGACYALGKIGPAAMPAKAQLLATLDSEDPFLAMAGAWALAQIDPNSPETAKKSVPVLIKALAEPDPMTRTQAADALGLLGALAKEAEAALTEAQKDESEIVREAAAGALKKIGAVAPPDEAGQPVPPAKGSKVVTAADDVPLKVGARHLAELPKGTEMEVLDVRGNWVGVRVRVGDETKIGWVHRSHVEQP